MGVFEAVFALALVPQVQVGFTGGELAPRDFFEPSAVPHSLNYRWQYSAPLGNWDKNAYSDFFIGGRLFDYFGNPDTARWDLSIASHPKSSITRSVDLAMVQELTFFGGELDGGGLINANGQPWLLGKRSIGFGSEISARNLTNLGQAWSSPVPGHATLPSATTVQEVFPGSDVNSDGWDDVFYRTNVADSTGSYFICGMLDGRTQASLWQLYFPDFAITPPGYSRLITSGDKDFNLDGVEDQIIGFQVTSGEYQFHALSGIDGSTIWMRSDLPGWLLWYRGFTFADVNSDNVADIVSTFRGAPGFGFPNDGWTEAINGLDGSTIWKTEHVEVLSDFTQRYGPGYELWFDERKVVVTAGIGPEATDEVWIVCNSSATPLGYPREELILRMNAEDGGYIGLQDIPRSAAPWSNRLLEDVDFNLNFEGLDLLGDIDGDGHVEFSMVTAIEGSQPNTYDSMLTILGARSLNIPHTAALGESIRLEVNIPSTPAGYWKLLASTQFAPDGGFIVDGWRTNLEADNLFRAVDALGPRGVLNSRGLGQSVIRIPKLPSLIGQTIYTRAVIVDPARPNRVKTISSVGTTQIR